MSLGFSLGLDMGLLLMHLDTMILEVEAIGLVTMSSDLMQELTISMTRHIVQLKKVSIQYF